VPAYIVLLVLVLPRVSGDDYSTAVEIALPTVFAAAAVGAIAADAARVWGWRRYLAAVAAVTAAAMTLALVVHETGAQ
jgi:hypothetical protein